MRISVPSRRTTPTIHLLKTTLFMLGWNEYHSSGHPTTSSRPRHFSRRAAVTIASISQPPKEPAIVVALPNFLPIELYVSFIANATTFAHSMCMPKKVLSHFKKNDPILHRAIDVFPKPMRDGPEVKKDLFESLCRTITGQQLSGKAAQSIWEKFRTLFPRKKPTAKHILNLTDEQLRASGISYAKINSVKDLSERVANRSLQLNTLRDAEEHVTREHLQAVKGIGPWTSEMFLMFAIGHEDVFSPGDLGLQKGIQKIYELKKLPTKDEIEKRAILWSPYRTYAACAIWTILDNR